MKLKLQGKQHIFDQIAEQYKNYIASGVLRAGEKLPSCRELAASLGINPNTVERAYSLLESEGFVVAIPKKGVFVAENIEHKEHKLAFAKKQIAELIAAGVSKDELMEIIKSCFLTCPQSP